MTKSKYIETLKKYSFKSIIIGVCQNIFDKEPTKYWWLNDIKVTSTDDEPYNYVTASGVIEDASIYCNNGKGRKTITFDELKELCILRNKEFPLFSNFNISVPINSLIAQSKTQKLLNFNRDIATNLSRDFYIFNVVDDLMKETEHYLEINDIYKKLYGFDLVYLFAYVMLFHNDIVKNVKKIIFEPYSSVEMHFLNYFGEYICFDITKDASLNLRYKPLIKIGKIIYCPVLEYLDERLSTLLYWRTRDLFKLAFPNQNYFPDNFGYYFETYVGKFLSFIKGVENIVRIDNEEFKGSKPDYYFDFLDYHFVVECKSGLIFSKDINGNLINTNFDGTVHYAFNQLKEFSDGTNSIKIVLIYENNIPLIDLYEDTIRKDLSLNESYILMTIDEFESLFGLFEEAEQFKIVLNELIESRKNCRTVSVNYVLKKRKIGKYYSFVHIEHAQHKINECIDQLENELINK